MNYIALAMAPGLAICIYFFYKDVYNREPKLNLVVSFIFGALAIFPAAWLENQFVYTIDGSLTGVVIFSYLVVGLSEESCRSRGYLFLYCLPGLKPSHDPLSPQPVCGHV